jgi:lysyl-tRNA synthetase class 1
MFWADRVAAEIEEQRAPKSAASAALANKRPLIVRDEKTLSGRVHIGSMRGVAIHGLVSEVLSERGVENKYLYELNDFDDFDTVPGYLDEAEFKEHLGKPLYAVPSPDPAYPNYAEFYGAEFVSVHKKAGFFPEYYRTYADLYKAGKMDALIRTALERAADVRRILKEVSGSVKDESWLPVSMVCERCGKLKTTRNLDFDGETVGYVCDQGPYGAVPCGYEGRRSPFGGGAKLFWKVDWAAKWVAIGVDVEGAGKDHSTKGGSRDVANHIAKEIFGYESPFDIPYEFFLVGGKKMSSSKGRGSAAADFAELFPPEVLRLALLGKDINQQINIDPAGDSVPVTYDWYDELADGVRQGKADDFTRLFELIQCPRLQAEEPIPWQMRFSQAAFMVQMPHLSLEEEAVRIKGAPITEEESRKLHERAGYAKFWLATYAPDQYKYALQQTMPAVELSEAQEKALGMLADFIAEGGKSGEDIHQFLHGLKTSVPIAPKELFSALYRIFLDRDSGPQAGWFLGSLPSDFVLSRLREAAA